jgi:hypothetical protein
LVERIALMRSAVETGRAPLADIKRPGIGMAKKGEVNRN